MTLAGMVHQGVRHPTAGLLLQPQAAGNRLRNKQGVGEWIQLDQPHAVGLLTNQLRGQLKGEPCLPSAAWSSQGHQAGSPMHFLQLLQLLLASDERGELGRQIGELARQGREGWELDRVGEVNQLVDALRPGQILQTVEAKIPERRVWRQLINEELLGGLAVGYRLLGDRDNATRYLKRIVAELPGTPYEARAKAWLASPDGVKKTDRFCIGCHE